MQKQRKYPEYFVNGDRFKEFTFFDGGQSYADDLQKAKNHAEKTGGTLYTEVDASGTKVAYLKGEHVVNRLGYVVVKY